MPRCSSFFCSGVLFVLEGLDHLRDEADLRVHARAGDEALAATVGDQRAHEGRVAAVAQRNLLVEHHAGVLFDRHRFAGERGFLDLEVEALEQAHVRRHDSCPASSRTMSPPTISRPGTVTWWPRLLRPVSAGLLVGPLSTD